MNDLDEMLGQLPRVAPDAARAQRVRIRCHGQLTRPWHLPAIARSATAGRKLESALVGGFCAVYFSGVALMALRAHGLL